MSDLVGNPEDRFCVAALASRLLCDKVFINMPKQHTEYDCLSKAELLTVFSVIPSIILNMFSHNIVHFIYIFICKGQCVCFFFFKSSVIINTVIRFYID